MKNITPDHRIKIGIYKITNLLNNDFYIGSTIEGFHKRFGKHKSSYKKYKEGKKSTHPHLFNAFDKYQIENFSFEILEIIDNKDEVRIVEEKYIKDLNPSYNICKHPSKGGSPNLGRKLPIEWKNKIKIKSKLYKHSPEIYNQKKQQNKDGAAIYKVTKNNETFIGTINNAAIKFNVDSSTLYNTYNKKYNSRTGIIIEKIKSQKKTIKVFLEEKEIIFKSFSDCDKYFNMWRGYTSTMTTRNEILLIEKYKYKII